MTVADFEIKENIIWIFGNLILSSEMNRNYLLSYKIENSNS